MNYKNISIVKLYETNFFSNLIPKLELDSSNLMKNMNSSKMYPNCGYFIIVNLLSHFITLIKNANFVCYCICSGYRINIEADNPRSCKWILKSIFCWMKNCAIWRKLLSIHIFADIFPLTGCQLETSILHHKCKVVIRIYVGVHVGRSIKKVFNYLRNVDKIRLVILDNLCKNSEDDLLRDSVWEEAW